MFPDLPTKNHIPKSLLLGGEVYEKSRREKGFRESATKELQANENDALGNQQPKNYKQMKMI